jgi:hypothetical protein
MSKKKRRDVLFVTASKVVEDDKDTEKEPSGSNKKVSD